jgi:hypothetical protein
VSAPAATSATINLRIISPLSQTRRSWSLVDQLETRKAGDPPSSSGLPPPFRPPRGRCERFALPSEGMRGASQTPLKTGLTSPTPRQLETTVRSSTLLPYVVCLARHASRVTSDT